MGKEHSGFLYFVVYRVERGGLNFNQELSSAGTGDAARANLEVALLFWENKSFLLGRHGGDDQLLRLVTGETWTSSPPGLRPVGYKVVQRSE